MKTKLSNCKGKCPNCHRQTVVKDGYFNDLICTSCGWWEGDKPKTSNVLFNPKKKFKFTATLLNGKDAI